SQVGDAVTQMDQATQQNAALVEEMAAAASSLKSQAQDLVQTVAVFKLGAGDGSRMGGLQTSAVQGQPTTPTQIRGPAVLPAAASTARRPQAQLPAASTAPARAATPKAKAPKAAASEEGDWESF
ncbi:methyl-accepting chemotaxis protein, partial [Rhodoferax sp. U11-2br]|nr:methyl-accepting chemotaxis protein [Rhodoferax sp. U11-2br]